jgi:serine/threonine-protein kinase
MSLLAPSQTRADRKSSELGRGDAKIGTQPRVRRNRPLGSLGKYRLLELIGSGAMGAVYRAEHVVLGRVVAVKVLHEDLANDQTLVERFFSEARAVNLIGHPHIVDVTDFAREPDGTVWFVMEFLDGCDLAALSDGRVLDLGRTLAIMEQVCAALHAVHAVDIVHRDIKPENIYITTREGRDFVKLLDFGIAHMPERGSTESGTGRGVVMGTPPYMAPEQATAQAVDHRSDLYAVGAVLYGLLTGKLLFRRNNLQELLEDVAFSKAPVPSADATLPDCVRDELDALVARCLAKSPDDRPANASELGAELSTIAARLAAGGEPSAPAPPRHYPLALRPAARDDNARDAADDDARDAVAVLASCRPKWQQRALWVAAVALLVTGAARVAPRLYPQLNQERGPAAATLGNATTGEHIVEGAPTAPAAQQAASARPAPVPAPAVAAADPPAAITPSAQILSAVVVAVPRAQATEPAQQAQASELLNDDRGASRTRARRSRIARSEATENPPPSEEAPVLTVAAVGEHGDANNPGQGDSKPDLDPDKLLDPFTAD